MIIKGILVKPAAKPQIIEFENNLQNLQNYVGGYIEILQLTDDEDVNEIINEEGKFMYLELNKILVHENEIADVLVGNILIVGVDNRTGNIKSIPEDKIQKYLELFSKNIIKL